VQVPVSPMVRDGLHVVTKKLAEIFVSSVAAFLSAVIFAPPVALDNEQPPFVQAALAGGEVSATAGGETNESLTEFIEHVALAHVASLRAPPAAARATASMSPPAAAGAPVPPRSAAALRPSRPGAAKARVAASALKSLPPAQLPLPTVEPAAMSAPVTPEPPLPFQFGMHLVSKLGTIISVSQTGVAEGVASVGDTLTLLVKKLSS
jgi:hypothetical protein